MATLVADCNPSRASRACGPGGGAGNRADHSAIRAADAARIHGRSQLLLFEPPACCGRDGRQQRCWAMPYTGVQYEADLVCAELVERVLASTHPRGRNGELQQPLL